MTLQETVDKKAIMMGYLKGTFLVDFLCIIPFELFVGQQENNNYDII